MKKIGDRLRFDRIVAISLFLHFVAHPVDPDGLVIGSLFCIVPCTIMRINQVTLRLARPVLGWVIVFGRVYHPGM